MMKYTGWVSKLPIVAAIAINIVAYPKYGIPNWYDALLNAVVAYLLTRWILVPILGSLTSKKVWIHTCKYCGKKYEIPAPESEICLDCALKHALNDSRQKDSLNMNPGTPQSPPVKTDIEQSDLGELFALEVLHQCEIRELPELDDLNPNQYSLEMFYLYLFTTDFFTFIKFSNQLNKKDAILNAFYDYFDDELLTPVAHERLSQYSSAMKTEAPNDLPQSWQIGKVFAKAFDREMDLMYILHGQSVYNQVFDSLTDICDQVRVTEDLRL